MMTSFNVTITIIFGRLKMIYISRNSDVKIKRSTESAFGKKKGSDQTSRKLKSNGIEWR